MLIRLKKDRFSVFEKTEEPNLFLYFFKRMNNQSPYCKVHNVGYYFIFVFQNISNSFALIHLEKKKKKSFHAFKVFTIGYPNGPYCYRIVTTSDRLNIKTLQWLHKFFLFKYIIFLKFFSKIISIFCISLQKKTYILFFFFSKLQ